MLGDKFFLGMIDDMCKEIWEYYNDFFTCTVGFNEKHHAVFQFIHGEEIIYESYNAENCFYFIRGYFQCYEEYKEKY